MSGDRAGAAVGTVHVAGASRTTRIYHEIGALQEVAAAN